MSAALTRGFDLQMDCIAEIAKGKVGFGPSPEISNSKPPKGQMR